LWSAWSRTSGRRPKQCEAYVDEFLIGEVFENLVGNAIKFSPGGTNVELVLDSDDAGVEFRVTDQGPGLTEEDKSRVFGRFAILSARPTGGEKSTGMGLYIVKKLVDMHGGSVSVRSEGPGKGATFTVKLPPQADPGSKPLLGRKLKE